MGNSSLANAIKRKTHKERSQPAARRKYGLLEKHKDYVLRAKDFHRKEKAIKSLQAKAEARNPDEFYFAMEHARTKGGVHISGSSGKGSAEKKKYTQEELLLMKTQDVKYLATKASSEAHKAERLRSSLHFLGLAPQARHTVFVDSPGDAKRFKAAEFFDTPAELLGRAYNRPRRAQLMPNAAAAGAGSGGAGGGVAVPILTVGAQKKLEKRQHAAYKELLQRRERQAKLAGLAIKMEYDKVVMGSKGRKTKLRAKGGGRSGSGDADGRPGAPPVFRWKRRRMA